MAHKRNIYLKMKPLAEARQIMFDAFGNRDSWPAEQVAVTDAVGRVLAEAVVARLSSPNVHTAAMDGIAVQAADTFGASETAPKTLTVGSQAVYINTGQVMPPDTNAVIMIEHLNVLDDEHIEIEAPAFPWQHVRKVGEDIVATELLFPGNHQITPYCIGALISGGVFSVPVKRRPKVLIIPTGGEVVDWQADDYQGPGPGQVLESNSFVLGRLVESVGGVFVKHPILADDADLIRQAVKDGVNGDFDMVLTIGGSSAGAKDLAKMVFSSLGDILVHGVTIMPGKPILVSCVNDKPVFGIPGYQVSAIIAFEQFVGSLIRHWQGLPEVKRDTAMVVPTRKIPSRLGTEEFVRVKIGAVGDRLVATPLSRGSGNITSITEADGIIRIPQHMEGLLDEDAVPAELLRTLEAVKNTIVVVGSHDNTLDVLADMIQTRSGHISLSSSHVGSMGGLMALKKGGCHLAGAHLLDTESGEYNTAYINRYLPDLKVRQVTLVHRDQGLIIPKNNPKKIQGLEDLTREDVTFLNRQGGSGTRILLDYRLNQLGINPAAVSGYGNEEFTHMAVAVAVLSGAADTGLGIFAAARALDLDFIPVVTEQYDLIIPEIYFEWENIQMLLSVIRSDTFKRRVVGLGGYHTEKTGTLVAPE
ncbi:MAG: molybdopterin biosynthesis protein [Deltaproteobacteria bacterium]|nr:MAG: molybdopterin biosynthesis protein [Deltaproteobacteria bacterium]